MHEKGALRAAEVTHHNEEVKAAYNPEGDKMPVLRTVERTRRAWQVDREGLDGAESGRAAGLIQEQILSHARQGMFGVSSEGGCGGLLELPVKLNVASSASIVRDLSASTNSDSRRRRKKVEMQYLVDQRAANNS